MTGFGSSKGQNERLSVVVEVRAVNNRYLKLNVKFPDAYAALEGEFERLIREHVARHQYERTGSSRKTIPARRLHEPCAVMTSRVC